MKRMILVAGMVSVGLLVGCEEKKVTDAAKSTVTKATDAAKDTAAKGADAVKDAAAKGTEAVKDTAAKGTEAVKDAAAKGTEAVKDAAAAFTAEAKDKWMGDWTKKVTDLTTQGDELIKKASADATLKPLADKLSGELGGLKKTWEGFKNLDLASFKTKADEFTKSFDGVSKLMGELKSKIK